MTNRRRITLLARVYLLLASVYLSVGVLSGLTLYLIFPKEYSPLYPAIIAFYFMVGVVLNYGLYLSRRKHANAMLNVFMMVRMVKLVLTIVFLLVGVMGLKYSRVPLAVSLMAGYFLSTGIELFIFHRYNQQAYPAKNGTKKK